MPRSRLRYALFDPDGRPLGAVDVPEGLRVYEIGADYILSRWQDALEVQYVRMYALNRAAGP